MTDEQIIKALECCVECDMYCDECAEECPLKDTNGCTFALRRNSLDLINRQKAEIESLKGDIDLYKKIMHNLSKELEESE